MNSDEVKILKGPTNILQVGTKDGNVFHFNNVINHAIKFNNDSRCYEIYFVYFDEGDMDSVYSTLVIPLNDLEVIMCSSLHGAKED